jgi:molybdopterin biosynthesis enzyme MoaB
MKFWLTAFFSVLTCLTAAWAQAIPPHAEGLNEELVEVQIDGGTQRSVVSRRQGKPDGSKLLVLLPGSPSVVRPEMGNGVMMNSQHEFRGKEVAVMRRVLKMLDTLP